MSDNAIAVAAAVARRGDRFLVSLRPSGTRYEGLWEFPGGKLHPNESLQDAIKRELHEELALKTRSVGGLLFVVDDMDFRIHFLDCQIDGEPEPAENSSIQWATLAELKRLALAPADHVFVSEWLEKTDRG